MQSNQMKLIILGEHKMEDVSSQPGGSFCLGIPPRITESPSLGLLDAQSERRINKSF